VRVPAIIAIVAYWALALPIGSLLAFRAHLGAVGIWIGLAAGLGVAAVGLAWRFHRQTQDASKHRRIVPPIGAAFPQHGSLP
jgi:MATE family multidrug resistance protein